MRKKLMSIVKVQTFNAEMTKAVKSQITSKGGTWGGDWGNKQKDLPPFGKNWTLLMENFSYLGTPL